MNEEAVRPFDERQTWWRRILAPLVCALACSIWSLIGLSTLRGRQHHDLYALLAHTDSAGTGQILWKPGGEHFAFLFLTLPGCCGVGAILTALVFGSFGAPRVGWRTVIGYWLFGLSARLASQLSLVGCGSMQSAYLFSRRICPAKEPRIPR
jgi:hypothetical protein